MRKYIYNNAINLNKVIIIAIILLMSNSLLTQCTEINDKKNDKVNKIDNNNNNNKKNKMNNYKIQKTDEDWKKELTAEQYRVLREKGTERPYTGEYTVFFKKGSYSCAACGNVLFKSDTKFDSHCGWPSFYEALDKTKIKEIKDVSLGMTRTEVVCADCGGHLGHVFDDGPNPTGLRYCINSVSIKFEENK